jgi:hypothetical protein
MGVLGRSLSRVPVRLTLFCDGYDELESQLDSTIDTRRAASSDLFEAVVTSGTAHSVRIVITCRENRMSAADMDRVFGPDKRHLCLLPFSTAQVGGWAVIPQRWRCVPLTVGGLQTMTWRTDT